MNVRWALALILLMLLLVWAVFARAQSAPQFVKIDGGSVIVALADISVTETATLLDAADNTRIALNCRVTSSASNIRWGDATVTSTKGEQIRAGEPFTITNRGAVYAISESGNVTMTCTKELK